MQDSIFKFTKGFHPDILDTHPLTDGADPYYSNSDFGTIVIDGCGMCLYTEDNSYYQETEFDSNTANFVVICLEALQSNQILNWIENFTKKSIVINNFNDVIL